MMQVYVQRGYASLRQGRSPLAARALVASITAALIVVIVPLALLVLLALAVAGLTFMLVMLIGGAIERVQGLLGASAVEHDDGRRNVTVVSDPD